MAYILCTPFFLTRDMECLLLYLEAGGLTVISVGERETQISIPLEQPLDSGMGMDDVTIWKKQKSGLQC